MKRMAGLLTLGLTGVLFLSVFVAGLWWGDHLHLSGIVNAYSLGVAAALVVGSEWVRRQPFDGDEVLRIAAWTIGGTVSMLFVSWSVLLDYTELGLWALVVDLATFGVVGAVGGLFIGVFVVRQRRANDELREARARLQLVLDASPLPIIMIDDEAKVRIWNPAATHVFGYAEDEVIGRSVLESSSIDDFDELVARFRAGELVGGFEESRRTKSGDTVEVRTYFSPIYDDQGDVTGGMAIFRDITEEEQRKTELERYRELLGWTERLGNVGGWEIDPQTETVRWTDGTKRIHGVGSGFDPDMESAIDFYHPESRETVQKLIDDLEETGDSYTAEVRLRTATGTEQWVNIHGRLIEDEDGDRYIRGAIQDISEQRAQEQRLMVLNRVLRHNLRNDLNVIRGRAELLAEELMEFELPHDVQRGEELTEIVAAVSGIATTSEELHTRISRFLDAITLLESFPTESAREGVSTIIRKSDELAALGEKAREFDNLVSEDTVGTEVVTLRPVLERIVDRYRAAFPEASITLECGDAVQVSGHEAQVEAVFEELVENALRHSDRASPEVSISVCPAPNNRVEVCVADRGPGLPDIERQTIQRGTETPLMHGKGIGLWLVNWAVTRVGGSLSVEDNVPRGTQVRVMLPAIGVGTEQSA